MKPFANFSVEQLPPSANPVLDKVRSAFGFLPNLAAVMAVAPGALNGLLENLHTFSQTSLSPAEQQLVLLTSSAAHAVPYSVAVDTVMGRNAGLPEGVIEAIRQNKPISDKRLEALRQFVLSSSGHNGVVSDEVLNNFENEGWTKAQMIEVMFGLAAKDFVYRVQRLADAPLDGPLERGRWEMPAAQT
jgi:alkylhydroperoxidase family enzyme